jgi:ribosomal protein S18 acetylase RimI-like enzyme|tara:strand:+ start:49 stop:555 length:507 start_codon:yes stop_codon:yes gene_type:complete
VIETVERNYLEILSLDDLIESSVPQPKCSIKLVKPNEFQINKFFYKRVGKKHRWIDRLAWSEKEWIEYFSSQKVNTYILKVIDDLAGYFELILHPDLKEIEISYLGLLEEYHNKKLGSFLLSEAIKKSFEIKDLKRVWVHTCTLDHKNAIKNYLARGMKIFRKETIKI